MIRAILSLMELPFRLGFGLIRLGFELVFGLCNGIVGLVFGVLGLVFGLMKGLIGLIVAAAIIAFVAAMFNQGYRSGRRQQKSASAAFDDFQSYYRQRTW